MPVATITKSKATPLTSSEAFLIEFSFSISIWKFFTDEFLSIFDLDLENE